MNIKKNKVPLFTVAQLGAFDLTYLLAEARKRALQIQDRRPLLAFAITGNKVTIWPDHYGSEEEARAACQDLGAIYHLPARLARGAAPDITLQSAPYQLPLPLPRKE